jgi:GT2 family glycosyltransferase
LAVSSGSCSGPHSTTSSALPLARISAAGKYLYAGDEKFWVRGVTYGTFRPDAEGNEYRPEIAGPDLDRIARNGFNAVRTYTTPPRWFMDMAGERGLRVMAGLGWQQHVAFLDSARETRDIVERVRRQARGIAGHPALLSLAIGNEIPAPIVRWHGASRVRRFLRRLFDVAREMDPDTLVTYVNYPSTEYLHLPFLDFASFNIYIESNNRLDHYLGHLQNVVADKPLVVAELGVDSLRNGRSHQARMLRSQVGTVFENGCAGAFVFAWTDEWHRGGHDVLDWKFGLTDDDRRPKPALDAVRSAFATVPFLRPSRAWWPRISVIVCSYNGSRTIRECLDGLMRLQYPDSEVIVVNDGSTDLTGRIAAEYPFRLIETENRGLSSARNTGAEAATGEIVAYIDDDAYPDPHWLQYLAAGFESGEYAAVGGPNIPPPGDELVASAVASAPGGPVHVLISDSEAEHIPGCNMAFRRSALLEVGGFDPVFSVAGDDVDICWRFREHGLKLGFSPGAVVFHHRRASVAAYWKQQAGYGRAEALLLSRWPEKYNAWGHVRWVGRVYRASDHATPGVKRAFHGLWGTALFQSLYEPAPAVWASVLLMPEWYLIVLALSGLAGLGVIWPPLVYTFPIPLMAAGLPLVHGIVRGIRASAGGGGHSEGPLRHMAVTALLYVLQPLARLAGRMRYGLTPWRRVGQSGFVLPWSRRREVWNETWTDYRAQLEVLEAALKRTGIAVMRGGDFEPWDLEAWAGSFGGTRLHSTIEEHGWGRQMLRIRCRPRFSAALTILAGALGALGQVLAFSGHPLVGLVPAALAGWMAFRLVRDAGASAAAAEEAVDDLERALGKGSEGLPHPERLRTRSPQAREDPVGSASSTRAVGGMP